MLLKPLNPVLLVLPTGTKVKQFFTYIAQQTSLKNKRALILVHRVELLRQTSAALRAFSMFSTDKPQYTQILTITFKVASACKH
jgi:superfamily II DNA or RNA helicase